MVLERLEGDKTKHLDQAENLLPFSFFFSLSLSLILNLAKNMAPKAEKKAAAPAPAAAAAPKAEEKPAAAPAAEAEAGDDAADLKKKRTFRKFSYRGVDLDQLLDLSTEELMKLLPCRVRRKFNRGLKRKPMALIKRLRKAKKEAPALEKPAVVKTHLRDMIIVPEMIGSIIGVYQGKTFNQVEVKPEMIGHYLGEFSITYKPVKHGRPGIGATHSSRFIPLK